ncbi:unnamed protein product [Rotaria socialis]|nr:unnamed protein product [Rotaria socialis]
MGDNRQQLEKWRDKCHEKIDCFFEEKCQEHNRLVNQKVDEQRKEIRRIQSKINEIINIQEITRQDIDSLASTIRQLEKNMSNIEQACFKVQSHPLAIDDNIIIIKELTEHEIDLSTLSPAYKQMPLHQKPNLCFYDRELNIAKQILWKYGNIWDVCWSSTLERFIAFEQNNIFLINDNTMSVHYVHTIKQRDWVSCTCSDTVLYATTNKQPSSIMEFTLVPTIKLIKEWKYPITCSKDETIYGIIYNNENLALLVKNLAEELLRIELRRATTFGRIWSVQLNICCVQKTVFRCCSLTCNEWLVVDYETKRLLQITKEGKIKKITQYHQQPIHALLFDENKLVVSTVATVNLHKIQ